MKWVRNHLKEHQVRIIEQANMLLNLQPNMNQFYENIDDTFRIFSSLLRKFGVSEEFTNSLKRSNEYLKQLPSYNSALPERNHHDALKQILDKLDQNHTDSFVIVPFTTHNHVFTGILRKIDPKEDFRNIDPSYSLIVVNVGIRPTREINESTHIEYVFNKREPLESFLCLCGKKSLHSVDQFYREFNQRSDERNPLFVKSREQVMGNCFTKEFEKSIKMALINYGEICASKKNQTILNTSYQNTIRQTTYNVHK